MTKKQLWMVIGVLVIMNILTIFLFVFNDGLWRGKETVAKIGKESVSRQEWLNEMEKQYGKEVLSELIDKKVIIQAADKYGVNISNKQLEHEIMMLKSMYHAYNDNTSDEKEWKEQIKLSILLEELLTKDVVISDKELTDYYNKNKARYQINPAYHISHIVVETEQAAKQVIKELSEASNFSVLAMERSVDEFSANNGGDIGFVGEEDERFSASYMQAVKQLNPGEWSAPVRIEDGYAIILLNEKIAKKNFTFKEVKNQIRRQIALEQMDMPISTKPFWEELKVDWFYGK